MVGPIALTTLHSIYIYIVYCGTPWLQAGEFCPALGQKPLQLEVLEGGIDAG